MPLSAGSRVPASWRPSPWHRWGSGCGNTRPASATQSSGVVDDAPGLGVLILIALVAPASRSPSGCCWCRPRSSPAEYGPSSTQRMPPIDTKTLHRSREALPGAWAAPLSEAGAKVVRDQFRCLGLPPHDQPENARLA
jgi:hypothetical protein